jgi:hypothetical protein
VDSEKASYKQKLEVLQQQEELIEDEAEQEQVCALSMLQLDEVFAWLGSHLPHHSHSLTVFAYLERGGCSTSEEGSRGTTETGGGESDGQVYAS